MQKYHDEIMALKGAEEIKEKIKHLHEFLKDKEPYVLLNSLADFLLVAKVGGSITTIVDAIAEYLCVAKAIEFCGKEKWFVFDLPYTHPDDRFEEIEKFDQKMNALKGFNRHFKGVVYIRIDRWIGHTEEEYFRKFIAHLATMDNRILYCFGMHYDNKKDINAVYKKISKYIRIETFRLRFPDTDELCEIVTEYIRSKGFVFAKDKHQILHKIIETIAGHKNFHGYRTLEKLSEDIVYHHFMQNKKQTKNITPEILTSYLKDSTFMANMKNNAHAEDETTKIGFSK